MLLSQRTDDNPFVSGANVVTAAATEDGMALAVGVTDHSPSLTTTVEELWVTVAWISAGST